MEVSRSFVAQLDRDERAPSQVVARRLIDVLHVPADDAHRLWAEAPPDAGLSQPRWSR